MPIVPQKAASGEKLQNPDLEKSGLPTKKKSIANPSVTKNTYNRLKIAGPGPHYHDCGTKQCKKSVNRSDVHVVA